MLVDDDECLCIDERRYNFVHRFCHQALDLFLVPTLGEVCQLVTYPFELIVVRSEHLVVGLSDACLQQRCPVQETGLEQRS